MARHYSQLYRRLRDLEPHDYQGVIRRYEESEADLSRLDPLEHFEITCFYVDALYATGAYRQHQLMIDLVIQTSIVRNLPEVEGLTRDVYQYMLFRKAAAAYRLRDLDTAAHVARELIRIDPGRRLYLQLLRIVGFKRQQRTLQFGRAAFVGAILTTALLIVVTILWVRPLYPEYLTRMHWGIGLTVAFAFLSLGLTYGGAYLYAHREAYGFQRRQANKKRHE